MTGRQLHDLFVLNLALQLFDGIATHHGLRSWHEGNPVIRAAMQALGPEQALLLFKAQACGWLVLLRRSPVPALAGPALVGGAGLYFALSYVPWMVHFLSLVWR
jgi:hypothetical protein